MTRRVSPPKCGTHTLHAVLCAAPWNGQTVVGPTQSNPEKLDRHVRTWPNEVIGHRKLVAVRYPLDRLVSLFLHFVRFEAAHGRGTPSFEDFCGWVVGPGRPVTFAPQLLYQWNLTQWLDRAGWDGLLKVDHLRDDLHRVGLPVGDLPRENASYRARPWQEFYNAQLLELVSPWALPDCERFGYDLSDFA
jgi:hypothetical protein